ncbi:MAG: alpha-amylase family glycosyl hydrolase, partial [Terracoccus sp.]
MAVVREPALPVAVASLWSALPQADRATLELRFERWWPDLVAGLTELYAADDVEAAALRLAEVAVAGFQAREPELRHLDERRLLRPDWLQDPSMIGYACYTERFDGTLATLPGRLDYLRELGVTYLHLMPLLRPRDGDNDGGYAVADYRTLRPDLGDVEDLRALTKTLRGQGISLVLDLVLNHVAREHEWAEKARAGEEHYRRYFHTFPDRVLPDAYECTLPEVFPDFAPGSFSWDEQLGSWVWTTFNEWQWDVNWSNPDVLVEYAEIILHLANLGVEVLRLDAIAFTWKRLGTNCQNQPEAHLVAQALKAVVAMAAPSTVLLAEAIVGPDDLVAYLGRHEVDGREVERRECDVAYHNQLMVQGWSMLATGETALARTALSRLPDPPARTTWFTYVRCHDDIGWAIDDTDAAASGVTGAGH